MNARDEVELTAVLLEEVAKPAEGKTRAVRRYTIGDLRSKIIRAAARSQRVPDAHLLLRLTGRAENAIKRQLGDGQVLGHWLLEASPAEVTALLRKAAEWLRGEVTR